MSITPVPRLLHVHADAHPMRTQCTSEVFTGTPGKYVDLEDTIKGFDAICKGEHDNLPEAAFYMVGTIEEAIEKAEKMAKEAAK